MKKGSKCVNIYINNSLCKITSSFKTQKLTSRFSSRHFEVKLNQSLLNFMTSLCLQSYKLKDNLLTK